MKNILVVITTAFVPTGGLTTVMMNYYRMMNKEEVKIDFASTNNPPHRISQNGRSCHQHISENAFLLFPHFFQMHIHYNFCLYEPSIHPQDIPQSSLLLRLLKYYSHSTYSTATKERQLSLYHLGMPYYFYFNHLSLSVCIKAFKISKSSTVVIFIFFSEPGTICISIFSSSSANKVQEATEFTIPFL
jgi:hypothetical protein